MVDIITLYKSHITPDFGEQIAIFLEEGFPTDSKELWLMRFDVWWHYNPAVTNNTPIGWMLWDAESKTICGFRGNIPIKYQCNNRILNTSASTSWYVTKNMRGENSTNIFMEQLKQDNVDLFVATTPAPQVRRRLLKNGFVIIDEGMPRITYLTIVNLSLFSSSISRKFQRGAISASGFKKVSKIIISKAFSCASAILPKPKNNKTVPTESKNYRVVQCTDAASFLPYALLHVPEKSIEISKDEDTLNWLLFSKPIQKLLSRTVCTVFSSSGSYCGYFIYDIVSKSSDKNLNIREIQLLDCRKQILSLIMCYTKAIARNNQCRGVYITLSHPTDALSLLLNKNTQLKTFGSSQHHVLFKTNIDGVEDPYSLYHSSDLDPDCGVI